MQGVVGSRVLVILEAEFLHCFCIRGKSVTFESANWATHMVVNKIVRDVWWIVLTYWLKVVSLAIPYEGNEYRYLHLGRVLLVRHFTTFFPRDSSSFLWSAPHSFSGSCLWVGGCQNQTDTVGLLSVNVPQSWISHDN